MGWVGIEWVAAGGGGVWREGGGHLCPIISHTLCLLSVYMHAGLLLHTHTHTHTHTRPCCSLLLLPGPQVFRDFQGSVGSHTHTHTHTAALIEGSCSRGHVNSGAGSGCCLHHALDSLPAPHPDRPPATALPCPAGGQPAGRGGRQEGRAREGQGKVRCPAHMSTHTYIYIHYMCVRGGAHTHVCHTHWGMDVNALVPGWSYV